MGDASAKSVRIESRIQYLESDARIKEYKRLSSQYLHRK